MSTAAEQKIRTLTWETAQMVLSRVDTNLAHEVLKVAAIRRLAMPCVAHSLRGCSTRVLAVVMQQELNIP